MSWGISGEAPRRKGQPVTSHDLEERINMYISAMDRASSVNDDNTGAQLQRDIQHLVDLMDKVSSGQVVLDTEVPPPLIMTPVQDAVANPLGLLSSRLSDYHKALYFAEEELSVDRLDKIKDLQNGLQAIHNLQKRAQAGFTIKEEEIPPSVTIPSDSEFDSDAETTIRKRLEQYEEFLRVAYSSDSSSQRRVNAAKSNIEKLRFLLTRAKAKRPVWHRDIPPPCMGPAEMKAKQDSLVSLSRQGVELQEQLMNIEAASPELQAVKEDLTQVVEKLMDKWTGTKSLAREDPVNLEVLAKMAESLERKNELASKINDLKELNRKKNLEVIILRIEEYKSSALKAKRDGNVKQAIQDLKVMKGLQPMQDALEKGDKVDMTLVPPPPRDSASPEGESPPSFAGAVGSADLSSDATTTPTTTVPISAHAQVSPFNLKQPAETAEDKLARKLTSFLEDDSPRKSFASISSSSSVDSDLSPAPHLDGVEDEDKIDQSEAAMGTITKGSFRDSESSDLTDISSVGDEGLGVTDQDQSFVKEGGIGEGEADEDNVMPAAEGVVCLSGAAVGDACLPDNSTTSVASPIHSSQLGSGDGAGKIGGEKDSDSNHSFSSPATEKEDSGIKIKSCTKEKDAEGGKGKTEESKKSISKSSLDAIGFLACQGVPEGKQMEVDSSNSVQNTSSPSHSCHAEKQLASTHSQMDNVSEGAESKVTNMNGDKGRKGELVGKDLPCYDTSGMPSGKENLDVNKPSSMGNDIKQMENLPYDSKANSSVSNHHKQNPNAALKETHATLQDSSSCVSSSGSPIGLSLPYSVNNQSSPSHKISVEETNLNLNACGNDSEVALVNSLAKQDVRNYYSLSDDGRGLEDNADMREFQDLMESMSLPSEKSSSTSVELSSGSEINASKDFTIRSNSASDQPPSSSASNLSPVINSLPSLGAESFRQNSLPPSLPTSAVSRPHHDASLSPEEAGIRSSSLSSSQSFTGQQESIAEHQESVCKPNFSLQGVQWTGLETLKYDMLLASNKGSENMKQLADRLTARMEKIKNHLRSGGRNIWEEYKECLERELHELNEGLKKCGESHEWDAYKYLNNKRMLNERELSYLNKHIGDIKESQ